MSDEPEQDEPIKTNEAGGKSTDIGIRPSLLPMRALLILSEVMTEGAEKHGDHNWRLLTPAENIDHAMAHLFESMAEYPNHIHIDELAHAACRLVMALETCVVGSMHRDEEDGPEQQETPEAPPPDDKPPSNVLQFPKIMEQIEAIAKEKWLATNPPLVIPVGMKVVLERDTHVITDTGVVITKTPGLLGVLKMPVPYNYGVTMHDDDGKQLFGEALDERFMMNFTPMTGGQTQ